MNLRLIEILLPVQEKIENIEGMLADVPYIQIWDQRTSEKNLLVKVLVKAEDSEQILDVMERQFSNREGFRMVMLTVDASLPRPEPPKAEPEDAEKNNNNENGKAPKIGRISREELYADISQSADITYLFILFVILSSIVASIGILKDSVAILIGAMVIAPLLGPNMALAFGTTLGDTDLIARSLRANLAGLAITILFSVFVGFVYKVDPSIGEIASRTEVGFGDIAIALAAGVAGTLSFTKGVPSALIGVMVAVALLPPTVTVGMLLGSGYVTLAVKAFELLMVNIICINLSGVVTFLAKGVGPRTWWESKKAKRATRTAIVIWTLLLLFLAAMISISKGYLVI